MKMVMVIVPRDDATHVIEALVTAGHMVTFVESRGGMLRQAQQMLFIALEEKVLEEVLDIIRRSCHSQVVVESSGPRASFVPGSMPVKAQLGGAVVFTWDLERFEKY
jgi:uncharacterized protein YaaQ